MRQTIGRARGIHPEQTINILFVPMIQRIQSLFLLFAMAASAVLVYLAVARIPADYPWNGLNFVVALLALVTGMGSLTAIFLYKSLNRQRSLVLWLQYAGLALVLLAFLALVLGDLLVTLVIPDLSNWAYLLLPVVTYLFVRLARGGIDKDIGLIRSMDRIR